MEKFQLWWMLPFVKYSVFLTVLNVLYSSNKFSLLDMTTSLLLSINHVSDVR